MCFVRAGHAMSCLLCRDFIRLSAFRSGVRCSGEVIFKRYAYILYFSLCNVHVFKIPYSSGLIRRWALQNPDIHSTTV